MRAALLPIAIMSLSAGLAVTGCGGSQSALLPSPTPTPTPAPTPSSTNITVSFAGNTPAAAAEQIGTGPWTAASLGNGQLAFTLPAGTTKYGIAFACGSSETVVQATVLDGTNYSVQSCGPPPATITGSVDATAIANAASVVISGPGAFPATVNSASGPFSLTGVMTGTGDIAAAAEDSSGNVLAVKIVRSQTIPGPINAGNPITFAANDAIATTQTISSTNTPAGYTLGLSASYVTGTVGFTVSPNTSQSTKPYAVVPASEAQPGDYYEFFATAQQGSNLFNQTFQVSTTAGPANVALAPPWPSTSVPAATFPTFTFNYTGLSNQPAVSFVGVLEWIPTNATVGKGIKIFATANFQSGSTTMTVPDLTSLPGFPAMAASGTVVTWIAGVYGGMEPSYKWFANGKPPDSSLLSVAISGTYTAP